MLSPFGQSVTRKLRLAVEAERERRMFLAENPGAVNFKLIDEIVCAGVRSLARKYHPDAGGSDEKMQLINVAADWIKAQALEVVTQ